MRTYQDLAFLGEDEASRKGFVLDAIKEHRATQMYADALDAQQYAKRRNVTILKYQKLLYTLSGEAVPDNFSANHKCVSNFFSRFITQEVQYLLANGVSFINSKTKERLGDNFDSKLQTAAKQALIEGVAFGFFNLDHLEVFQFTEFVPLYDEDNGSLRAGIRFWQISSDKPLRATLYEEDGYTDYIDRKGDGKVETLREKRPYQQIVRTSVIDGTEIYDGENYPSFPIVPLWGNPDHQSELVGLRSQIDAYDLIKSGFANDLDDASMIYWTLTNSGGMDDVDLARFVERMKTVKAAVVDSDDGQSATAHTIDVPYQSRETYLARLEKDMYKDAMALDTDNIASGATTATQIKAAYEPLNNKTDQFEYCVNDFVKGILALVGIDDEPTFTRSKIVNTNEEIQILLQAAQYLTEDYVTEKVLMLLGDGDRLDDMLKQIDADNLERMTMINSSNDDVEENDDEDEQQEE